MRAAREHVLREEAKTLADRATRTGRRAYREAVAGRYLGPLQKPISERGPVLEIAHKFARGVSNRRARRVLGGGGGLTPGPRASRTRGTQAPGLPGI
jgi:hypothetical protein